MLTTFLQPLEIAVAVSDRAFYQQLGLRIANGRKALGMNQTQLADLFGITQQTMAKYESGQLRVDVAMLPQLSDTLGLSIEELIGRERKKNAARPTVKRGPTPRIQQQLEAVSALPRAKQRAVMQVLDAVLQQASR